MKCNLSLLCIGSVIFALSASGAPDSAPQKAKKRGAPSAHVAAKGGAAAMRSGARTRVSAAPMRTQRRVARAPVRNREFARSSRGVATRSGARTRRETAAVRERTARERVQTNGATAAARERQLRATRGAMAQQRQVTIAGQRNFGNGNAWRMARNRNVRVVNTWRSNQFSGAAYAPFRNYARVYHNNGWYHDHYSDITFVLGGWWYWNAGYWYPAWGYDPRAYYAWDGPIYAYNGLPPDQVVANVQAALQAQGYYQGDVDGLLGPLTRQAIADYQRNNDLYMTSAIDEPTLASLGMT